MVDKVTETKGMNFQINDPIQKAYDVMLGIEDVVEQPQEQQKQDIKESVKEISDLPVQINEQTEHEITVGDYTTSYFYMCGSAQKVMNANKDIPGAEELTKLQDEFYELEKNVMNTGQSSEQDKSNAQNIYDQIMTKASEIGLADKIDDYMKMHLDSILVGDPKPGFGRTDISESTIKELTEVSDDILVSEDGKEFVIDEKKFSITQGVANAFRKPELAKGKIMVKKICSHCNFHMPAFTGRYPNNCPLCGTPFSQGERIKYSLNTEGEYWHFHYLLVFYLLINFVFVKIIKMKYNHIIN